MSRIDATHDPDLTSWVDSANGHADFPIQNLPFGVFAPAGRHARIGVAIGDFILDVADIVDLLPKDAASTLGAATLNAFFALPQAVRIGVRRRLSALLSDVDHRSRIEQSLVPAREAVLHLPAAIGDYTDFYAGIQHARNVGRQFRPDNPLLANYKHVPIGYHGRASSVRPSGTPVIRPRGQIKPPEQDQPIFGPSARLDYELELGIWIGPGNDLGTPIPISRAADHVAGFCLLNDWSARDIQAWEYQPLGPFLAKNFHTSVSPWVITAEALAPFRIAQPARPAGDPAPLPYLLDHDDQQSGALAIELSVLLSSAAMRSAGSPPLQLSRVSATDLYWTVGQIVTHHASNGCDLRPGDLIGTGTISGEADDAFGSLLEISRGGAAPFSLPTGERRTFLEDGDEVTFRGVARREGFVSIGFGACAAVVRPAR